MFHIQAVCSHYATLYGKKEKLHVASSTPVSDLIFTSYVSWDKGLNLSHLHFTLFFYKTEMINKTISGFL